MSERMDQLESKQRALISWLADHCGRDDKLGKTALQKLMYSLTEIKNVNTGYNFSLYTYGPYSKNLQADLDTADLLKLISLSYIEEENRYIVRPSVNSSKAIESAEEFIQENIASLRWVSDNLGGKSARYLELYSTIHYIIKKEGVIFDDDVVTRLIEIKPKFGRSETLDCVREVKSLN